MEPELVGLELDEEEFGALPVAAPPRYQLPMSVSWPFWVNIVAFGPTLEIEDLNDPKYEYLST